MEDTPKQNSPEIQYPEIAKEIIAMQKADQNMRRGALKNEGLISKEDENLDKKNTEKMKEIVSKIGWPSFSKVGEDASVGAWLLVQHADHDTEFQSKCLSLMQSLPTDEVRSKDIALLIDRILVNKGRPQIYGTQFRQKDGKHIAKEIEDIEHVDERRKSMGLDTFAQNVERMYQKYPFDNNK